MTPSAPERARLLSILRSDIPLERHPDAAGLSRDDFTRAARTYLTAKAERAAARKLPSARAAVELRRDPQGAPHIFAVDAHDLHFAWGWATAQDRLWQMDHFRRAARGTLPEILGADALPAAIETLTVGIGEIADATAARLPQATRDLLSAFAAGVNAYIEQSRSDPPIEFEILEYDCAPWLPADSVAVMKAFWWQLTGRLFMITGPELVHRALGEGPLYSRFLRGEGVGESIIPPGENRAAAGGEPVGLGELLNAAGGGEVRTARTAVADGAQSRMPTAGAPSDNPAGSAGSNNWALGPALTGGRGTLFASDPHTPYTVPSIWHQVRLRGAGLDVAGAAYVGVPGVIFGRSRGAAWGITNNICSQRDLFTLPVGADGRTYRVDDAAHEIASREITVPVRGAAAHVFIRRSCEHGPVVNALLPPPLAAGGPIALRWVGAELSDEIGAMQSLNRAQSVGEVRESLRRWSCPTFNFLCADADGHVAYQTAGRLPVRRTPYRGLRDLCDPTQRWAGYLAFERLPHALDPKQGWLGTANNPVLSAGDDPGLGGQWPADNRMRQLRRWIERSRTAGPFDLPRCASGQTCVYSARAAEGVPQLLAAVGEPADATAKAATGLLREWNFRVTADGAAAAIWEVFSRRWTWAVFDERLDPAAKAVVVARQGSGLVFSLLAGDPHGWFAAGRRTEAIRAAFAAALAELTAELGADASAWNWGRLHTLTLRHPLGRRPNLAEHVNTGPVPIDGDGHTLNNQHLEFTGSYEARLGPVLRIAAAPAGAGLSAANCPGNSGDPGGRHYRDQFDAWLAGKMFEMEM